MVPLQIKTFVFNYVKERLAWNSEVGREEGQLSLLTLFFASATADSTVMLSPHLGVWWRQPGDRFLTISPTDFSSLFSKASLDYRKEHTQEIHRVVANLALRRGPLGAIFTHTASVLHTRYFTPWSTSLQQLGEEMPHCLSDMLFADWALFSWKIKTWFFRTFIYDCSKHRHHQQRKAATVFSVNNYSSQPMHTNRSLDLGSL